MRRIALFLLLLVLALALPNGALADSPGTHTVAWGETLFSIARYYGVAPQTLASTNGIGLNSWVYAGERLTIPGMGASASNYAAQTTPSGMYTIRAGDTLYSIARQFGVYVDALAAANNTPVNGVIYVGWQLKIPGSGAGSSGSNSPSPVSHTAASNYIVQPGDTLSGIAVSYGVTMQSIQIANNLSSWFVYSGQRLSIPSSKTPSTPAQNPAPAPNPPSAPAITSASAGLNVRAGGIPVYRQRQTLTCEEAAAAMALRGVLSENQIVKAMPRSDNPFYGIRGGTNYPFYGGLANYGTYAQGLQKGLANLGRSSTALYGQAYGDFKNSVIAYLKAGKAVIWWTTWRQTYQSPAWVRTSAGGSVLLVPYEHTVVVIAANDAGVTYDDPYDASVRFTSWGNFQRASAYFNNMALVVQ